MTDHTATGDGAESESGFGPGPDRTVLLVSNRRLDENAGRAEKFATRARLLRERGWDLRVGYVEPTATGLPVGTARCLRLAREADVVNSVSNPPQLQIAGAVAARLTDTPWVAEFRDPLVENPDVDPDSAAALVRRRLERYVLTHADRVVWYDGIQLPDDYFAREYPSVPADRYEKLPPIGFERETFERVEPRSFDRFTVAYAGSFYEGWIEPYTFLEGLGAFVEATPEADPQALFYGDWSDDYERAAGEAGVADHVVPRPFVPHEEIVSVLKGADALLYVGGDDPRNRLNLPSKLYDYVGAGRPILAVVDPSFRVADVVREEGFGLVVEPGDAADLADALERLYAGGFDYAPDPETIAGYTRERSTDAYVAALEAVAR
jgi:glycosyltransferase involved in cell wall biosynthesis